MNSYKKLVKNRKELLGRVLNELGNFNSSKFHVKLSRKKDKVIVIDNENTVFGYYRFNTENPNDKQNYYLFMKEQGSNLEYHYNMIDRKENPVELLNITYDIDEKREIIINLENKDYATVIITEKEKKYLIFLSKNLEIELLNNIEKIGLELLDYSFLNLERVLNTIKHYQEIVRCVILHGSDIKATVDLNQGTITNYQINDFVRNLVIKGFPGIIPEIKLNDRVPIIDVIYNTNEPYKEHLKKLLRWS